MQLSKEKCHVPSSRPTYLAMPMAWSIEYRSPWNFAWTFLPAYRIFLIPYVSGPGSGFDRKFRFCCPSSPIDLQLNSMISWIRLQHSWLLCSFCTFLCQIYPAPDSDFTGSSGFFPFPSECLRQGYSVCTAYLLSPNANLTWENENLEEKPRPFFQLKPTNPRLKQIWLSRQQWAMPKNRLAWLGYNFKAQTGKATCAH